jgi:predicted NAD/FAD-binding protein
MSGRARIVIVGAGIAGITAAWLLGADHDVTLIERNAYVGGHTNTIAVREASGIEVPVDTGFIVCNPKTYPLFYRLLNQWGVPLRDSDMSFGYFCESSRLGYVGPLVRDFCRRYKNFVNPSFLRMLLELRRFNRQAKDDLHRGVLDEIPLGLYLQRIGATAYFQDHYLLPVAAAIWSSPDEGMLQFPASSIIRFLENHGLLDPGHAPVWQTVVGGSQAYVRAFRSRFAGEVICNAPARAVERRADGVTVYFQEGAARSFDHVVMAAHADESLALLADASAQERQLLSAWRYHRNPTILHTDASVLPPDRSLWASWNYYRRSGQSPGDQVPITYYMNRLQGLECSHDYFVSLNADHLIDPAKVIYQAQYTHPAYTSGSLAAQRELKRLNGSNRTSFCGSYMGYGFHEDAVAAAAAVAQKWGVTL